MRQSTAIGLAVLVLVVAPLSARSTDEQVAIAGGSVVGMIVGVVCWLNANADAEEQRNDEYARRGWRVDVGGSYAIEAFDSDSGLPDVDFDGDSRLRGVDDSLGINARAGYRCHPRFSAEVEVEWLEGFDADVSLDGGGEVGTVDLEPVVVTTNVKGYFLTGRYQPFLLLGGGAMTVATDFRDTADMGLSGDDRETAFAVRFGAGMDVYATKHIVVSVGADYVLPIESLNGLDYISVGLGLGYRF